MLAEAELDRLMARLSLGDRAAFDAIYAELSPRALRYALARLPRADAEDAAQNALTKIFSRASEFTPGRAALPWFYAVLLNEIRAVLRKRGREVAWDALLDPPSDAVDAEARLEGMQVHARLGEAIDMLDAPSRAAVMERLGDTPMPTTGSAALRKRLSRTYSRLRLLMGVADEY